MSSPALQMLVGVWVSPDAEPNDRVLSLDDGHYMISKCDYLESTDAREVKTFFQGTCMVMGYTSQFAVNRETRQIVRLEKKGRPIQRELKPLIALGFDTWLFSWTASPRKFLWADGSVSEISSTVDLSPDATLEDALRWQGVL